jgi:AcrR family transcriptional regulator
MVNHESTWDEGSRSTGDGDTEHRILNAAHRVFLRRGTHGARMQEVADEAGVNKALLHYYFRSKDRLAEAVFERAVGDFFPRLMGLIGSDLPIEEKVEAIVHEETDFLAERPYLPGYIISELTFDPERIRKTVSSRGTVPVARLQAQLDQRIAAGELRPIRAEQFIVNLVSLIVFPFAARPLIEALLGLGGDRFAEFRGERRATLAAFFLNALRP